MKKTFPLILLGAASIAAFSEETSSERMGMDAFFQAAVKEGHQLKTQESQVEYSQAREDSVRSNYYPMVQTDLILGPSPGVTGDAITSETHWDNWSYVFESKLQIIQPIAHWGTVAKGLRAAQLGTSAERALLERDRWALRSEVARYYYGYQFAFEMREMADETGGDLKKALQSGENRRKKKSGGAPSLADLDRLRGYIAEADVRKAEAQKGMDLAKMAMAWKLGWLGGTKSPRWDKANLEVIDHKPPTLETLVSIAQKSRPEFQALSDEQEARKLQAEVEESKQWPNLFAGIQASYNHSPNRTAQNSVFANDPYNSSDFEFGIGIRWTPFSKEQKANVAMARAEWRKAEGKNLHLKMGIAADVEQKYREFTFNNERRKLRKDALSAADKVFRDNYSGFMFGTVKAKDLLQVMGENVVAKKNFQEAVFDENVSWVVLEQSVGTELNEHSN